MSIKAAKRVLVEPDYWTCPHGVRQRPEPGLTFGPEVAELCAKANFAPDPQQELGLDLIFAFRPDGSPVTFSFCVICARQNLKSGLFLQASIGWLFVLDDVPEIVWSAHLLSTALGAQQEMLKILDTPALSHHLKPAGSNGVTNSMITANGQERFEFNTGQKMWFQTRSKDGGRGLGKPKVILDEAFKLKSRIVGALLPILLAQHHPQVAYGSSQPPPDEDAAQLRDVIDRGRNHKSPEMSYLEWLAKREVCRTKPGAYGEDNPDCTHPKDAVARGIDCALDREHLIRQANPTLTTGRITLGTIRNLRQELPPVEYMRECMGWEDEVGDKGPPKLDSRQWNQLKDEDAPAQTKAVAVIDVEPDGTAATIGLVGDGPGGRPLVSYTHREGTAWVVKSLTKVAESVELLEIDLTPSSSSAILRPKLKKKFELGKRLPNEKSKAARTPLVSSDLSAGCTAFVSAVNSGQLVHLGQDELTASVGVGRTRVTGANTPTEQEYWDRLSAPIPFGPIVAVSTALQRYLELNAKPKPPPPAPVRAGATTQTRAPSQSLLNAGF